MKANLLPISMLLALAVSFCACNKSGKLGRQSEFTPPSGPMEFKLKWPQGERIEQRTDMKMKMDISLPGKPEPMHQDATMGLAYGLTVLQANADGTHDIELDFESAQMAMTMAGKPLFDYDSEKPAAADRKNPVGDIFSKMVGSKIRYHLDASNSVERVEGVDELLRRLDSGADRQAAASLKNMFNEGYFKQMMQANLMLPDKPVQPGDQWPVQLELPAGPMGTMVLHYDFTFKNWEMHGKRNCARLEFQGDIQSKPAAAAKAPMSFTIQEGATSGVSWFDPELGITIDTTTLQSFTMLMQVPVPGARGQAPKLQTFTTQMQQNLTVKLISVK